ncbi:MAG TPA: hypothetical protein ENI87_03800 [bacterium]|nr:hypothetical protein [bacterium]
MAKKHKHEEHVNHERWVISFADMMTLLFALFVVLYAMGVQDLEKLKKLKKSIQFAFNIAGEGKTKDTGLFDKQKGGGEIMAPVPMITAQDGEMRQFLDEVLEDFEEVAGKSLDINVTNDTITLTAPMSRFFEPFSPRSIASVKPGVRGWIEQTIDGALSYSSDIRIVVEPPSRIVARYPDGRGMETEDVCWERIKVLRRLVAANPRVMKDMVAMEMRLQNDKPGEFGGWEDQATVTIGFSNMRVSDDGR